MEPRLDLIVSDDEATTWRHHRAMGSDFEHGYCYTAIQFLDDTVRFVYNPGRTEFGNVFCRHRVRRVPVAWPYQSDD